MSIGFATLASTGSKGRSASSVSAASGANSSPAASQASAQRIPRPPAFVSTATLRPRGNGWPASSAVASSNSPSVSTRRTPAWRKRAWAERGVQARARDRDPQAVRPEQARAVRTDEREQLRLAFAPLRADFGEACGDDADRADAGFERLVGRGENRWPGDADDRKIDRDGNVGDGGVRLHAGNGLCRAVDREGCAREVSAEHVAEELAADRAAARRGADDGDGRGREERTQRRRDCAVVALVGGDLERLRRSE